MKTDLAGRLLARRYRLQEPMASGGMATVWRAQDEVLGRAVAAKILREEMGSDPDVLDRFQREAVAAARLSHRSVVQTFDTGLDEGTCFIVMELLDGPTLQTLIEQEAPMDVARAVAIISSVLNGLAHAHASEVIHRDIKPANVLTDGAGHVKVADFGIAKAAFAGGDLTTTGKLLGTAAYLAPEQVSGGPVDGRADLYATGVMLYEMLTARQPFEAPTDLATATLRLTADPRPPRARRPQIPAELDEIVMRSLARDPEDRFSSAEEMNAALHHLAEAPGPAPIPVPEPTRAPAPTHASFFRSWMLVPLVLLVLAAVLVGAGLMLGRLELGGPLGVRATESAQQPRTYRIVAAIDHDPGGDGREHPQDTPLAIDGDASTHWRTERYNSPDLGGLKSGVGLILDLGEPRRVDRVSLRTTLPGWSFQLQGSDDGAAFHDPIPDQQGTETFVMGGEEESLRVEPVEYRYFLVWITDLAPADDGYRATIADVELAGA